MQCIARNGLYIVCEVKGSHGLSFEESKKDETVKKYPFLYDFTLLVYGCSDIFVVK